MIAVLFICHVINEETLFRYRLLEQAAKEMNYDIFWVMDESTGVLKSQIPSDIVPFWFSYERCCGHLPFIIYEYRKDGKNQHHNATNGAVLSFYSQNIGKYDHLWVVEYDACFTGDWKVFFERYSEHPADLIASNFMSNLTTWEHLKPTVVNEDFLSGIRNKYSLCRTLNCLCKVSSRLLEDIIQFYKENNKSKCCFFEWVWSTVAKSKGYSLEIIKSNSFGIGKIPVEFSEYEVNTPYHAVKLNIKWENILQRIGFGDICRPISQNV